MAKITDEHKVERGKYFELGVYKVNIAVVEQGFTEDDREYFDFTVVDDLKSDEPTEASVRLWFHTDKAIGYSFSIVRGIFTMNATEDKKDAIKADLKKIDDTDDLIKTAQKLVGKECWLQVAEDPTRTYQNESGETKPSINRNIMGYEPKPVAVSVQATPAQESAAESGESAMADF